MSSPNIVTLTAENFDQEVIKSGTPPILDELATEYDGKVKIGKVNIDDHQSLASEYGIRAIPTLLLFKDGQVADQIVGLRSKRDFKAKLDRVAA
jgi:thioredoxin 1